MKKSLLVLAVLGASTMAFAESQVTLYGKIDESVLVGKGGNGDTTVSMKSGYTAMSRWGIKGTEDLGNGYTIGFTLEQGITANNGAEATSGLSFSRESLLYVNGGFGRLTFGRMGVLGFAQSTAILQGPVFGVTYGTLGWGSDAYLTSRINNGIAYQTPSFGGLTVHAMYSNGTSTDTEKWSSNGHYYGIGAKYASKDIGASLIFETIDNKGQTGDKKEARYQITVGGWWQLGAVRPMAVYGYQWGKNYFKQHAAQIGAQINAYGGTARAGFRYLYRKADGAGYSSDLLAGKDSGSSWNIGVGYEYPLSKRTKVYAAGGYTDGNKGFKDGGADKEVYFDGYQIAVGLVHDF